MSSVSGVVIELSAVIVAFSDEEPRILLVPSADAGLGIGETCRLTAPKQNYLSYIYNRSRDNRERSAPRLLKDVSLLRVTNG